MTKKEPGVPKYGSERAKKSSSYKPDPTMGALSMTSRHAPPPIHTGPHDL